MDHDRPVPCGCASLTGAVLDIGDETRVAGWHVPVIHLVGEYEDRYAVVVIALPASGTVVQAAWLSERSTRWPRSKWAPARTRATRWGASTARHRCWADSTSLKTMHELVNAPPTPRRDYERHSYRSEAMIHLAIIDLMARRPTGEATPTWRGT